MGYDPANPVHYLSDSVRLNWRQSEARKNLSRSRSIRSFIPDKGPVRFLVGGGGQKSPSGSLRGAGGHNGGEGMYLKGAWARPGGGRSGCGASVGSTGTSWPTSSRCRRLGPGSTASPGGSRSPGRCSLMLWGGWEDEGSTQEMLGFGTHNPL